MVMANIERRRDDNSNTQHLLLDSVSTIHITTSKRGMTDLQPCNKAVNAANKGRSYMKEVGTQKFRMAGKSRLLIVSMEEMHVLEGFMHDLISLPMLLKKGCEVVECTSELIRIRLPFQKYDYMDFKRAEDGVFYLDAIPLDFHEPVEQANSNIMPDNDSSGEDEGNTDGENANGNADDNTAMAMPMTTMTTTWTSTLVTIMVIQLVRRWNQSISIRRMSYAIILARQSCKKWPKSLDGSSLEC
jgi:hypothetical protein